LKPWATSGQYGLISSSSTKKHTPMVATNTSMIASSRRKPRFCRASTSKVSNAVRAMPKVSEQPSNK
jgi:hypothetical protein